MSIDTDRLSGLAHKPRASHKPPTAPTYVYLLAEHLDAALAAGEDLLAKSFTWNTANPETDGAADAERAAMRHTFREIQQLEILIVARVLRAREHAITLEKKDTNFRAMAGLFISSVTVLMDAVAEIKDPLFQRFETGDALTAYMRSRGILDDETPAPIDCSIVDIPGFFRIARRIELGALMDLLAMFLDALEIRFDIFLPDDEAEYAEVEKLSALTVRGDPLAAIRRAVAIPMAAANADETEVALAPAPVAFGLRAKEASDDSVASVQAVAAPATAVELPEPIVEATADAPAAALDVVATVTTETASEAVTESEAALPMEQADVVASAEPAPSLEVPAPEGVASAAEPEAQSLPPATTTETADATADASEVQVADASEATIEAETPQPDATAAKEAVEYESLLARLNAIVGPESESVTRKPPILPPSPTVDATLKTIALVGQIFREPLVPGDASPKAADGTLAEASASEEAVAVEVTLEPAPTPEPAASTGETIDAEYEDVVCAS